MATKPVLNGFIYDQTYKISSSLWILLKYEEN